MPRFGMMTLERHPGFDTKEKKNMRKLVIMRGHQGSSKSTILERTGLKWHTISVDQIRETVGGVRVRADGGWILNPDDNSYAWKLARESMDRRMRGGETIAIDATFPTAKEVHEFVYAAKAEGYDVLVVDRWSSDREIAFERNQQRHPYMRVPRQSFDKFCRLRDASIDLNDDVRVLETGDDVDASVEGVLAFLNEGMEVEDLSSYDRIVHVGDIQGCLAPVLADGSPVARFLDDPKSLIVFVGDLFDRGPQNGEVARWWLDHVQGRPNVRLIAGNHEDHVELEAKGLPPVSVEFAKRTLPQLKAAGVSREDLATIASSLITHMAYTWRGTGVMVTHAGLPIWPDPLWGVPAGQMRKGVGTYSSPIDETWGEWSATEDAAVVAKTLGVRELWQVHGHRNQRMRPVIAAPRSVNLEGQIEFGGMLRCAVLDESGWTPSETRNVIHNTMQEFRMQDIEDGRQTYGHVAPLTPWALRGVTKPIPMDDEAVASLRESELVYETVSETLPNVSAFNFTKTAFFKQAWTGVTVRARGLFLATATNEVVARGWDKYFNRGQRRETSDEALMENLAYPIVGYVKENGFLGVTGYDEETRTLVVGSKARLEGAFAGWFETILRDTLGDAGMEKLLRFNRDQVASCDFEVIDPVNDPHIIEEARPRVVLLDAIRRDATFECMPYEDLLKLGAHLGCEVKRTAFKKIPNWPALKRILDQIENDEDWRPNRGGGQVEGVVVVDANGFMFKVKGRHYALWKRARGAKERILLARRNETKPFDASRYEDDVDLKPIIAWLRDQNDETLDLDIVKVRQLYLQDVDLESKGMTRISHAPAPKAEPIPDQSGFLRGVDAMAAQLKAGTVKPESLSKMVARASEDEHRLAAFDAHPAAAAIRDAAEEHDRARFMLQRDAWGDVPESVLN
jgi:predicted kinase